MVNEHANPDFGSKSYGMYTYQWNDIDKNRNPHLYLAP